MHAVSSVPESVREGLGSQRGSGKANQGRVSERVRAEDALGSILQDRPWETVKHTSEFTQQAGRLPLKSLVLQLYRVEWSTLP